MLSDQVAEGPRAFAGPDAGGASGPAHFRGHQQVAARCHSGIRLGLDRAACCKLRAVGDAIVFGLKEAETNRFFGRRRVIDLSGDGRANDGYPLRLARQAAIDKGVTINGLAILNELPFLDRYFQSYLIGGNDAFVMAAQDYGDFARAMTEKLLREIRAIPLARNNSPAARIKAAWTDKGSRQPGANSAVFGTRCSVSVNVDGNRQFQVWRMHGQFPICSGR